MNQHYVPKCYLKGFSDENGYLYTLDLDALKKGWKAKPFRTNVGKVCHIKDYYEVPKNDYTTVELDNSQEGYVESALGVNESLYPSIRNKFLIGDNLTIEDYIFLADFIIMLKLRNPQWQKKIKEDAPAWLDKAFAKNIAKQLPPKFSHIPDSWREAVAEQVLKFYKDDPDIATKIGLHGIIERTKVGNRNNERVRAALLNNCWTILDIPERAQFNFITSDNPGYSMTSSAQVMNNLFQGDFTYLLPLTSKHCLKISSRGNPSQKPALGYFTLNRKQNTDLETVMLNLATSQIINKLVLAEKDTELSYLQKMLKLTVKSS